MRVGYRPRAALRPLAKQFRGSGEWRFKIVDAYPETASVRYLAAPLVTLAVAAGLVTAIVGAVIGSTSVWAVGLAVPAVYVLGVLVAALLTRRDLGVRATLWYPLALITMHLSWGTGFLVGVVKSKVLQQHKPETVSA